MALACHELPLAMGLPSSDLQEPCPDSLEARARARRKPQRRLAVLLGAPRRAALDVDLVHDPRDGQRHRKASAQGEVLARRAARILDEEGRARGLHGLPRAFDAYA